MMEILEGYRKRDPETGLIFPWYTWPCLEWLASLNLRAKKVWEYGAGDSTKWYRSKGAVVKGVDHDRGWLPKGIEHKVLNPEYPEAIKNRGIFDIVVIDGIWRDECTGYALKALKSGGYLIIDNYHQKSVEPNVWTKTDALIKGMEMTLYRQPRHYDWATAVITKT